MKRCRRPNNSDGVRDMDRIKGVVKSKRVQQYAMIILGCFIGATAYPLFLEPNHIPPGGFTVKPITPAE